MNIRGITMLLWILASGQAYAQTAEEDGSRFYIYTQDGETYMDGTIEGVDIIASRPSARTLRQGQRRLDKFTRLLWNVHKTYPYSIKVAEVMHEVERDLAGVADSKARRQYIQSRESSLFGAYEGDLRKMTRTQGQVLVKLIHRETGKPTYHLIKEMKSGASAVLWQSIGVLFGINLKSDYDPEEDAMIEDIVNDLERGGYNICYKQYNYTLR